MSGFFHKLGIIIGAMKCGTTALHEALSRHPEVAAAVAKETDYFSNPLKYQRGSTWYSSQFCFDESHHVIAVESSPTYTMFPTYSGVSQRMRNSDWSFRFVYVVRNPFERISSHYIHAAVEHSDTPPLQNGLHSFPIEVSSYFTQLEFFSTEFGKESILIIMYEDLVSSPSKVLRCICDHLGIRHDVELGLEIVHASEKHYKRVLIIEYLDLYGYSNRQLTRKNVLEYFRELPAYIQEKVLADVKRHYELNAEHKLEIRSQIGQEMRLLQRHYGVDVERWGF